MRREGIDSGSDVDLPSGKELVEEMWKGKKRARYRSPSLEIVDGTPYGQNPKRGRRVPAATGGPGIPEEPVTKGKRKATSGNTQPEVIDVDEYVAGLED